MTDAAKELADLRHKVQRLATLMEQDAAEFVAEDGEDSDRADYAEYIAGELAKMAATP
jgi:hypothetical protein